MEEEGQLLFLSHRLTFCFFLWGHFCLPVLLLTSQGHSWNSFLFFFDWWVIPLMPVMTLCTLKLGFSSLLWAVVWLYRQEFQVLEHRARTCKLNWIFSFPLKVLEGAWCPSHALFMHRLPTAGLLPHTLGEHNCQLHAWTPVKRAKECLWAQVWSEVIATGAVIAPGLTVKRPRRMLLLLFSPSGTLPDIQGSFSSPRLWAAHLVGQARLLTVPRLPERPTWNWT